MATVLCIGDNRNLLELHRSLLESNGYRVLIALDGPTVLRSLESTPSTPWCSISICPGWMRNEVAQVMAKEQPMLPVVICSGYIDEIPESLRWFADALLQQTLPVLCFQWSRD